MTTATEIKTLNEMRDEKPSAGSWIRRGLKSYLMPAMALPMDVAAISAAFALAHILRFHFPPLLALVPVPSVVNTPWSSFSQDLTAIIPVWLLFHFSAGLYRKSMVPFEDEVLKVAQACFLGSMATLAIGFLYHRLENSRLMILLAFPIATVLVLTVRQVLKRIYIAIVDWTQGQSRILLLGNGRVSEVIRKALEKTRQASCFSLKKASLPEILEYCATHRISEVIVIQMDLGKEELLVLSDACEKRGVDLKIVPGLLELRMGEVQVDKSLGLPMFHICHTSFSGWNFAMKRMFDIAFCVAVLGVLAIPLAIIALLIKLESRGPILFTQRRYGYKGLPFQAYKFRTMVTDAEAQWQQLKSKNESNGALFKMKNDPRVTRFGKLLRRLSIDEIPQFLNVLKGEMSVVGPRPLPSAVENYGPMGIKRLHVLPGVTGLWQVSGRSDLDFDQMVALDLFYLEHWSPGLDLKIILKTPGAVFSSRGAY